VPIKKERKEATMLKQVSIFVENKAGRVYAIMETLTAAKIKVRAMTIAETAEFGIIRFIVSDAQKALDILRLNYFTAKITDVIGFTIPDRFGALCDILRAFDSQGINIEYSYSFMGNTQGGLNIIMRVSDSDKALSILNEAGVKLISANDMV
jgi:hypothetical protein